MDQFDYLSYKRNKINEIKKEKKYSREEKLIALGLCFGTFAFVFIFAMIFISTKISKIDIEYGRLGKDTEKGAVVEYQDEEDGEEILKKERFTVDKRLFLIQQEEKGPSKSKVVSKTEEQSEVISTNTFNEIKSKNDEFINKPVENKDEIKDNTSTSSNNPNKIQMKPKLPTSSQNEPLGVRQLGAIDSSRTTLKVLVGRYDNIEDIKRLQESISTPTLIKKINNHYSLQIGAYENPDTAKSVAGKLKVQGYDVWIFQ